MRSFKKIQEILGTQPDVKKIYLIGCTGAGKTSLVQHIIGSKKHDFPVTSHRRTTIAPTEYVIKKDIPFKTTIILKNKKDVVFAIEELIQGAILKAKQDNSTTEDVVFELEQSPDDRFKLNQMVKSETFLKISNDIITNVLPTISGKDINDETLLSDSFIKDEIKKIVTGILAEIEGNFNIACGNGYTLFTNETLTIDGINDKDEFILKTKKLLSHDFGSISILAEYIRIEGDLLADWLEPNLEFLLIDGEGIGHSLGEKRDTLSARHYNYFNYCNNIVLIDDANDPFAAGGHGAIEGIFLNGYQEKFKLVFSKTDKLEQTDQNAYFRRNLNNLRNALKKDEIEFNEENKDTYKLNALDDKSINEESRKAIQRLLTDISNSKKKHLIPLEYDFDLLLSKYNSETLVSTIFNRVEGEHWAVVKALSKRLQSADIEYRHLKPISWILTFLMYELNSFLKRDELTSEVFDSQNIIKQNVSYLLIQYIYTNFIKEKEHLWQQAYEKSGFGSHRERKDFIFNQIVRVFLPSKDKEDAFKLFKKDIKDLLLKSGALELKTAVKTEITHVSIKKIFGYKNVEWSLGDDVSVLIGKNGCGKSTLLKLIFACINNDEETLESFGSPYVELTILKTFDNGETQTSKISQSKSPSKINVVMVNTFDIKLDRQNNDVVDLDSQLLKLTGELEGFQRGLLQSINKTVGEQIKQRDEAISKLTTATPDDFIRLQELSIKINDATANINKPLIEFKSIIDEYFSGTNKSIIVDDEDFPLVVEVENNSHHIKVTDLSSGEKQLLIIFLTVILQKNKSFILLMDEPETSLHVEWQATFIDFIKKLNPNVQIIIATHNPLILLNRESDEIGIIEANNDEVQKRTNGTKYLDISSILLDHFKFPSLVGTQMQNDIQRFSALKMRESELNSQEQELLADLGEILENSLAGDIIYNKKYFEFLTFLKNNKHISYEQYEASSDQEMTDFLSEFGDSFND